MNFTSQFQIRGLLFFLVVTALAVSGCASQSRPTVASWEPQWAQVVAAIPQESALGDSPADDVCTGILAMLRERRPLLNPTPDAALDGVVQEWFQIAEGAFFECPPRSELIGSFADAYQEMSQLEAEIDVVLDLDR